MTIQLFSNFKSFETGIFAISFIFFFREHTNSMQFHNGSIFMCRNVRYTTTGLSIIVLRSSYWLFRLVKQNAHFIVTLLTIYGFCREIRFCIHDAHYGISWTKRREKKESMERIKQTSFMLCPEHTNNIRRHLYTTMHCTNQILCLARKVIVSPFPIQSYDIHMKVYKLFERQIESIVPCACAWAYTYFITK